MAKLGTLQLDSRQHFTVNVALNESHRTVEKNQVGDTGTQQVGRSASFKGGKDKLVLNFLPDETIGEATFSHSSSRHFSLEWVKLMSKGGEQQIASLLVGVYPVCVEVLYL